jgi:class 3 adenylate cyclase/tetratricopeptide (TPR) repeat protein
VVRKTVTVLFADVTGSTRMGERLDPEALRRLMTRYYEGARSILEGHGATVEKFIGDAVMAVFGVPTVHEDDARRAARAALELRRDVAALGLELRIGINTGEVVAEEGDTLVSGDAVNVAARLEQAAAPGEILLGDGTYAHARDALRVEQAPPVQAKGKSEPVAAWRLLEVRDAAFPRPLEGPFVGREEELRQLVSAFERTVEERAARRFTLLGTPGIGKSRLARELAQRVAGSAQMVAGRCPAYGEGITYWPLAEVVRTASGGEPDAIAAIARDALVGERLGAAVGGEGVAGTKEETQWAARRYLEELAADRPLVVVLDDLHWAEPTFLDLVEYVADFASAPIFLVCTARPELVDIRPSWTAPRANATALMLDPLAEADVATLAGDIDDVARRRILDAAEGNPLFVQQLVAMGAPYGAQVPPTLQALLEARIDSLSPGERTVVECAAVEGRVFHRGAVVELVSEAVRPDIATHLLSLVRKEFVRPDRAELRGDDGYRFVHILVRDAAYESMSKELRADLHERFVGWLDALETGRPGEIEEVVGYHLERATRYRRELDLPDRRGTSRRAAELLLRSGTRAYDRGDMPAAQTLLGRAVSLLPPRHPQRAQALVMRGAAILGGAGGMDRALAVLEEALDESRAAGDRAAEASAWATLQLVRLQSVPTADIEGIGLEAEARVREVAGLPDARPLVCLRRLQLTIALTRLVDLDHAAERLLAAARRAGDHANAFPALFHLCASGVIDSTPVREALAATRGRFRALAAGPLEEAIVEHIEGLLRAMGGELDVGRQLIVRGRSTFAEFGRHLEAVATARDEALVARYRGDAAAVERILRPACDALRAAGDTGYLSVDIAELGDALYELGRYDEAEAATVESERLAQRADLFAQIVWRRVRAKVLAHRGELGAALQLAHESIRLARSESGLEPLGDAYRDLAGIERRTGHAEREEEALAQALAAYELKGLVPMADRTRADLAALRAGAEALPPGAVP